MLDVGVNCANFCFQKLCARRDPPSAQEHSCGVTASAASKNCFEGARWCPGSATHTRATWALRVRQVSCTSSKGEGGGNLQGRGCRPRCLWCWRQPQALDGRSLKYEIALYGFFFLHVYQVLSAIQASGSKPVSERVNGLEIRRREALKLACFFLFCQLVAF